MHFGMALLFEFPPMLSLGVVCVMFSFPDINTLAVNKKIAAPAKMIKIAKINLSSNPI